MRGVPLLVLVCVLSTAVAGVAGAEGTVVVADLPSEASTDGVLSYVACALNAGSILEHAGCALAHLV